MKKPKKVGSTLPKRDSNVIFSRRAALLSFAGAGVMGTILFRMGQLQVSDALNRQYSLAADENRFDTRIIPPPRGVIYDRFRRGAGADQQGLPGLDPPIGGRRS
ncbi:MAG: hypothetical protein NVV62_05820 [Terricaulis sp.]|nr:hypothetical protein [Terricaulis sp.]